MDHHRSSKRFVHEAARVVAVDAPGATPALRAYRGRRCATDLEVDNAIDLEHAVDAQPSQMRK
jgi:hypothetical protein